MALFDEAVRLWGPGRGSVAIRDYTATGLKQPMFPGKDGLSLDGGNTVDAGFPAGTAGTGDSGATGYSFNLAFRDELSGALIIDAQDELDQKMLYPDQLTDANGCGHGVDCVQLGVNKVSAKLTLPHQDTYWEPNRITRTSNWHKTTNNTQTSFRLFTVSSVSTTEPEIFEQITIHNRLARPLDLMVIPDQHGANRTVGNNETFVVNYGSVDVIAVSDIGPATSEGWRFHVPPESNATFTIALRLCKHGTNCSLTAPPPAPLPHVPCKFLNNTDFQPGSLPGKAKSARSAEACCVICAGDAKCAHASFNANENQCYMKDSTAKPVPWDPKVKGSVVTGCTPTGPKPNPPPPPTPGAFFGPPFFVANLSARVEREQAATQARLAAVAAAIPTVATGNTKVDEFYARSVLSVLLCRMSSPEFAAVPFFELGNSYGESNSWDLSFAAGLISWMEPAALKKMMLLMFKAGILEHSYLSWNGGGGGL
jgi:hypothetical protein